MEDMVMYHAADILCEGNTGLESERLQRREVLRRHPRQKPSPKYASTTQQNPVRPGTLGHHYSPTGGNAVTVPATTTQMETRIRRGNPTGD